MDVQDKFSDAKTLACPWSYYNELREKSPVFYSPSIDAFVVTGFDLVSQIERDLETFSNQPQQASSSILWNFAEEFEDIYTERGTYFPVNNLTTTDGDVHRRHRELVDPLFGPSAVKSYEAKVTATVDQLIDNFIDRGEAELYSEFCTLLPLYVMCDLLGIPRDAKDMLQRGADATTRLFGGALEPPESRRELAAIQADVHLFFQPYLDRYRAAPEDNMLSRMVHARLADGTTFTDQELLSMLTFLNVGGNETTTNGLGNSFYLCFTTEGAETRLREHPEEIPKFIEEALRLQPPVTMMPRWAKRSTELAGVSIPEGACIQLAFVAAGRDTSRFECPERLDVQRKGIRNHLSFGSGKHYCLGAPLARSELKIGITRLLERVRDIRLLTSEDRIDWQHKLAIRALTSLPISFSKVPA